MARPPVKPANIVLNEAHPLARGLYRAYPFLERGGGILHDVGPNAHHGTFSSSTYRWGVGPIGPDKEFTNGGTDSVACPDWNVPTGSVTISAWIVVSGSSGDDRSVVGVDDSGGNLRTFQFRIDNSGVVPRFIVFYDGGSVAQAVGSALPVGKLVHMVGTNNKGTAKTALWIDGVKVGEDDSGAMDNDTTTMFIGSRDTSSTDEFWGFISDVRVWDRALAPSEILELYTDPWAIYTPVKRSASAGVVAKTGTGALSMLMPTVAGVGEVGKKTAIGALTMLMPTAAGVGVVGIKSATGALTMLLPTAAGVGEVGRKTATGALDMLMPTAAGVGTLTGIRIATGALDMLMPTVAGVGIKSGASDQTVSLFGVKGVGGIPSLTSPAAEGADPGPLGNPLTQNAWSVRASRIRIVALPLPITVSPTSIQNRNVFGVLQIGFVIRALGIRNVNRVSPITLTLSPLTVSPGGVRNFNRIGHHRIGPVGTGNVTISPASVRNRNTISPMAGNLNAKTVGTMAGPPFPTNFDTYLIGFPYLDKEHLLVEIDGVALTIIVDWDVDAAGTSIVLTKPTGVRQQVTITRQTPHRDPLVSFTDGAKVKGSSVQRALLQALYYAEEVHDRALS